MAHDEYPSLLAGWQRAAMKGGTDSGRTTGREQLTPVRLGKHGAPALWSMPERTPPRAIVIVLPGGGFDYDKRWAAGWLPPDDLPVVRAYVDLPLHGARLAEDLRERWRGNRVSRFFAPAILGMAAELPSIIDQLSDLAGLKGCDRVAVCGWSIGGLAAFLAAVDEPRIAALAGFAIPGGGVHHLRLNPDSDDPEEPGWLERLDLLRRVGALPPRAVLLMHGTDDSWVDAASSRSLFEALSPVYDANPERLRYVEYDAVGHDPCDCAPPQRRAITDAVDDWLATHLLG